MAFVLDASITACWAFDDEDHPDASLAFDRMRSEEGVVPGLWWFEVRNILIVNERRRRITESDSAAFLLSLSRLRIRVDRVPDENESCGWLALTGCPYTMPSIWNWLSARAYRWQRWTPICERQRPTNG